VKEASHVYPDLTSINLLIIWGFTSKTYFKTWEYALEKRKSRLLALFFPVYDMKWNAFII
jgi:hypothetical protein